MKPIEELQSGAAWQAAIAGGLANAKVSGALTVLPLQAGLDMLSNVPQTLDTLANLANSPDSVIGAVVAAIKYVVSSLRKAAAERELNFSAARCGFLAEARGLRVASNLTGYQGCRPGRWNYPRASIAKDRCVPVWDYLGTPTMLPEWALPDAWRGKKTNPWWPYDASAPVGQSYGRDCYDWEEINLDTGKDDCDIKDSSFVTMCWPWAWPLHSPVRVFGHLLRYSKGPEDVVAAQYALPTPQHVLTYAADVAYSKQVIKQAMLYFWPDAYEAAPGDWRNNGKPLAFDKRDPNVPGAGVAFHLYAAALGRIAGFERCRAALLLDRGLVPDELQSFYSKNSDFSAAPPPPPKHPRPQVGAVGKVASEAPSSGGGGIVETAATAGLLYMAFRASKGFL